MGTIWIPGGSGGADTSVVTATAEDVLAPKVIVGPDGEPIDGTMVNNGAVSHSLPINGTYPIPKGYHDGNGKVSQSIPVQGGSTTTPGTVAKTIVAANRYVNGNIVVAGDPNLIPANVKKGVPIFGVMGIAEGYFPMATDLYLRGQNLAPFDTSSSSFTFQSGQLFCASSSPGLPFLNPYNLTPYNWMNFEINFNEINFGAGFRITIVGSGLTSFIDVPEQRGVKTISLNLSNINASVAWNIKFSYRSSNIYIYRIWLS